MRGLLGLAALLSVEFATGLFIPEDKQFVESSVIVPRGGGSGGSRNSHYQPAEGGRNVAGWGREGKYHEDAPGNFKAPVREVVRKGEKLAPDRQKKHTVKENEDLAPNESGLVERIYEKENKVKMEQTFGKDGGDHTAAEKDHQHKNPAAAEAEYAMNKDKQKTRTGVTGGLPRNKDRKGSGSPTRAMNEEKQMHSLNQIPENSKHLEAKYGQAVPPIQVSIGADKTSNNFDKPMGRVTRREADKWMQAGYDVTSSTKVNVKDDVDLPPVIPLRSTWDESDPKQSKPVHQVHHSDTHMVKKDRHGNHKVRSLGDSDRKRQHSSGSSSGSSNGRHRDKKQQESNRRRRRDMVGSVAKQQANGESTNPDQSTSVRQDYQEYMLAYETVQGDAWEVIKPHIQEMVRGHNSTLVWDAAWEIASIIDPTVIVVGPFREGTHALYWYEEHAKETTEPAEMEAIQAINDVLIDLYFSTYEKVQDALTKEGLLHDLVTLGRAIAACDPAAVADIDMGVLNSEEYRDFFGNYLDSPLVNFEEAEPTTTGDSDGGIIPTKRYGRNQTQRTGSADTEGSTGIESPHDSEGATDAEGSTDTAGSLEKADTTMEPTKSGGQRKGKSTAGHQESTTQDPTQGEPATQDTTSSH